ncbi:MAG: hypothetical protein AAGF10_01785 [Verrucomicrobiota bacterium]
MQQLDVGIISTGMRNLTLALVLFFTASQHAAAHHASSAGGDSFTEVLLHWFIAPEHLLPLLAVALLLAVVYLRFVKKSAKD